MELTAQAPGLTGGGPRGHGLLRPVRSRPQSLPVTDLWERHGSSAYALACALLGDETAAAEAVLLAMADLARSGSAVDGEIRRRLAHTIYRLAQEPSDAATGADRLPPAMVWLTRLARLQR